jgi:hypothetical protein
MRICGAVRVQTMPERTGSSTKRFCTPLCSVQQRHWANLCSAIVYIASLRSAFIACQTDNALLEATCTEMLPCAIVKRNASCHCAACVRVRCSTTCTKDPWRAASRQPLDSMSLSLERRWHARRTRCTPTSRAPISSARASSATAAAQAHSPPQQTGATRTRAPRRTAAPSACAAGTRGRCPWDARGSGGAGGRGRDCRPPRGGVASRRSARGPARDARTVKTMSARGLDAPMLAATFRRMWTNAVCKHKKKFSCERAGQLCAKKSWHM